jgi:radical SAM protein with 4Fe4S-binding SPASM domain
VCKKCKFLEKCGGGSRFAANLVNGSYYSLDPLAQPEKFEEKLFN